MCGICGIFHMEGRPVSSVNLKRMTDAIRHRGPDGGDSYVEGNIGLGHRRLAIIDLSPAGRQPMQTSDGRYVLSFNGEVYNFRELRMELEALGYAFRSHTDSEVVLYAFAEWGERCLDRFNGMFAFAVWDKFQKRLFVARDRYGIKPLYYAFIDGFFLFASEAKAIATHPAFPREVDTEALLEYFTFQNIFTDRTLFKRVKLLPAGCYAHLSEGGATELNIQRFWDYNFQEPADQASDEEYAEELDRLFRQAVNRQLVSDVGVNTYLSGGMDSGAITALASQQIPYIKSFTCGFDMHSVSGLELSFDEREKAEHMSYLFRTEHYEMVLKAGDMERCLPKLAWHLEEPRVGQSYPNFYASQLASKFGKVVLAGTGGDELFGGYPWRYYRAACNSDFESYIDKYYLYWQRLISNTEIKRVFSPVWDQVSHVWTRDIFRDVFVERPEELVRPEDYINHSMQFEAKTFLHGLLVVEDKLSMAHGLETRVPFLDNDLVDFAMQIPMRLKLGNLSQVVRVNENDPAKLNKFFHKTRDGKLLLRKAMLRYIPQEVSERAKQGFSAPDATWFKGESIDYVKALLFDRKALVYDYLDRDAISSLVKEHFDGKTNRRLLIWSLLNFEWWLKLYIAGNGEGY